MTKIVKLSDLVEIARDLPDPRYSHHRRVCVLKSSVDTVADVAEPPIPVSRIETIEVNVMTYVCRNGDRQLRWVWENVDLGKGHETY